MQENQVENLVGKMVSILSCSQCINKCIGSLNLWSFQVIVFYKENTNHLLYGRLANLQYRFIINISGKK